MLPWNPPASFSQQDQPSVYRNSFSPLHQQQQQQQLQQDDHQHQQQQIQQQYQQQHQANQSVGQHQQQPGVNNGNGAANHPPAYPPMTLASTLHFLQSEHRRYAKDRNEWEIERAEMRARIALLEGEKRGNEGALRDLARRCKMLENALRGERSKFLSSANAIPGASGTPSASGAASPVQPAATAVAASGIPPIKAAQLLSNLNPASSSTSAASAKDKDFPAIASNEHSNEIAPPTSGAPESVSMVPSTSSTGVAVSIPAPVPNLTVLGASGGVASRAQSALGVNGNNVASVQGGAATGAALGTWGPTGTSTTALAGRDPRGKARTRDYLKQCLQEITYLTSTTTMNPLSSSSYGAPSVPRPRKTLPEQVPASGPGIYNISLPPPASCTSNTLGSTTIATSLAESEPRSLAPSTSATTTTVPAPHPITQFPSDPASAFVPLKRTISQPGNGGLPSSAVSAPLSRDSREPTPASFAGLAEASTPVFEEDERERKDGPLAVTNGLDAVEDEVTSKPPSPPLEAPPSPVNKATTTISGGSPKTLPAVPKP